MHYVAMRLPRIAVVALGLCIAMSSAGPSFADATPTPSPDFQSLMAQFKIEMVTFQKVMKSRELDRMKINQIFMSAVNDANRNAKTTLKAAKTPTAKSEVITTQKAAIAVANAVRDAAILAMGQPPVAPIAPVKPSKTPQMSPTDKTKSRKVSPTPSP